jgi:hypothetical protein
MEESEIRELIASLNEAKKTENWDLIEESIDYLEEIYSSFSNNKSHDDI